MNITVVSLMSQIKIDPMNIKSRFNR